MKRSAEMPSDNMRDAKSIFQQFVSGMTIQQSKEEIRGIALLVLEKLLGLNPTEVMAGKSIAFTDRLSAAVEHALKRINNGEPVQYVIEEAYFFGRLFLVNSSVLIPRPETEELIRAVLAWSSGTTKRRIVDIGTGSGCIAITLALELKDAEVFATDVSPAALAVAGRNSAMHGARVSFIEHNILRGEIPVGDIDILVSNPPYVTMGEADQMERNVKDFEPHLALFVADDDPLSFYRAIAQQAADRLTRDGLVAVEINERYGSEVTQLFIAAGYRDVELLRDVPGKPRVVRARRRI